MTQTDSAATTGPPSRWRSRGYMPHFDARESAQHVTYHLADSLPADYLARLREELLRIPDRRRAVERRKRIDQAIDAGYGSCLLRDPASARMVQDAFLHFDGPRYWLFAWVVMPNHVHVLFQPQGGWTVARFVASWKSFTGRRLVAGASHPGSARRIWHREYWDRFIRDEQHFRATREYIHFNPVKAGLVERPEEWEWSSARIWRAGE